MGVAAMPTPYRCRGRGLPALSATVTVPFREPTAVGVKVTLIVQLVPAAIGLAQLLVWAKSPLATMPRAVTAGRRW